MGTVFIVPSDTQDVASLLIAVAMMALASRSAFSSASFFQAYEVPAASVLTSFVSLAKRSSLASAKLRPADRSSSWRSAAWVVAISFFSSSSCVLRAIRIASRFSMSDSFFSTRFIRDSSLVFPLFQPILLAVHFASF